MKLPTNEIIKFWFRENKIDMFNFWFDGTLDDYIRNKYSYLVDNINKLNYKDFINDKLDKIVLLLVGDQFTRNIYRDNEIQRKKNDEWTLELALEMLSSREDYNYDMNMRYFILLPLRHNRTSKLLNIVYDRITNYLEKIDKIPLSLIKFLKHTIKDYTDMTDEIVESNVKKIELEELIKKYNKILEKDILFTNESKINISSKFKNIGISLSGGVDSMVLLHYFVMNNYNVVAIHIEHCNRKEAKEEREFLEFFCKLLNVKMYYRTIHYINRDDNIIEDRHFYEEETRKIRFNLYKYVIQKNNLDCICLGHHQDDAIENVLVNVIKNKNINDLITMKDDNIQYDVRICRPLINIIKDDIFSYAHKNNVPYFLNSTPIWSSRHMLRSNILPNLKKHFGKINNNMINFSKNVSEYIDMCNDVIINPYIRSLEKVNNDYRIKYNKYMNKEMIFSQIIMKIMHENGYHMISNKSLKGFIDWLNKDIKNKYILNKYYYVSYEDGYLNIRNAECRTLSNYVRT